MDLADNFNAFRTSEVNPSSFLGACEVVVYYQDHDPLQARYITSLRKWSIAKQKKLHSLTLLWLKRS